MNIAFFIDGYYPTINGVISVITQLKTEFEKAGHNVIIVTVESRKDKSDTSMEQGVYRVPSIKAPLRKLKGVNIGLPSKHKLVKILQENNIQICHAHTEFPLGEAAYRVAREMNIPCIATTHTQWDKYYRYYFRIGHIVPKMFVYKWLSSFFGNFDSLINVSNKAYDWVKQPNMVPSIPSVIIPNSFNEDNFSFKHIIPEEVKALRESLGIKENEKVILSAGRLVKEKRVKNLLKVCKEIVTKIPDTKVLFVGGGIEEKKLRRCTAKYHLEDKILFTSYVPWKDIPKYYALCDLFITVSLSEMHSMTILEALAMGKPVVCRKDTSFTDTIIEGFNGFFADSDSEIVSLVNKVFSNPDLYKNMCENAFAISRNFVLEKQVNRHLAIYDYVIKHYTDKIDEEEMKQIVSKI